MIGQQEKQQQLRISQHQQQIRDQPLSPLSNPSLTINVSNKAYTIVNDINYVKSIRRGQSTSFICIYEQQPFTIQFRNLQLELDQLEKECTEIQGQSHHKIYNMGSKADKIEGQLYFQNVPYDCLQFIPRYYLISSKAMPPRIYKTKQNTNQSSEQNDSKYEHIGSICNRKKNSQLYLSPIELSNHRESVDYAIGGGRRFVCRYNLQKMVEDEMYHKFDKTNVSTVSMLDVNTAVVGTFQGALSVIDLRQNISISQALKEKSLLMRPHVDAVMSTAVSPTNQYIFATSARKDNYTYVWDCRKYINQAEATFISELVVPKFGNQRINLCFSNDGRYLYTGSQNAQVIEWEWQTQAEGRITNNYKVVKNGTVNTVLCHPSKDAIIFSSGSRSFEPIIDQEDEVKEQMSKLNQNMLGCLFK